MAQVFAVGRLRRARAAVAAHALRRGDAALRLGPPGPALRPGDRRRRRRAARTRSSRSSSRCSAPAASCARSTPGGARLSRSELDELTEVVQRHGGKGGRVGGRRGGRRVALADRQVPRPTSEIAGGRRSARRLARATCCCSSPTSRDVAADGARRAAARARPPLRLVAEGATTCSGSSTSRCSSATRTRGAGTRCTTRSPRRRASFERPRRRCARARYDIVVDGSELGGGSIRIHDPDVQRKVFERDRHGRGGGAASASASCSTRCATARRRTAASRSGIDRIVALLAGRDSIRDVIAFPKTASGAGPDDGRAGAGRRRVSCASSACGCAEGRPPVGADLEIAGALLVTPEGERRGTLVVEGRADRRHRRAPVRMCATDDRRGRPRGASGHGRLPRALHGPGTDRARGLRPPARAAAAAGGVATSPSTRTDGP